MSPELQRGIEKMKAEIAGFIEMSKTVTAGPWETRWSDVHHSASKQTVCCAPYAVVDGDPWKKDSLFIARSRSISPTMAECLLVTVKGLEHALLNAQAGWTDFARLNRGSPDYDETYQPVYGQDVKSIETTLQEVLTMWEAAL